MAHFTVKRRDVCAYVHAYNVTDYVRICDAVSSIRIVDSFYILMLLAWFGYISTGCMLRCIHTCMVNACLNNAFSKNVTTVLEFTFRSMVDRLTSTSLIFFTFRSYPFFFLSRCISLLSWVVKIRLCYVFTVVASIFYYMCSACNKMEMRKVHAKVVTDIHASQNGGNGCVERQSRQKVIWALLTCVLWIPVDVYYVYILWLSSFNCSKCIKKPSTCLLTCVGK